MGADDSDLADLTTAPGASPQKDRAPEKERYVLLDRVGEGGMGVVWAAYDRTLDRKVALKLLHDQFLSQPHQERLVREARAMARLAHPNVVPVFDAGEREGRTFLTMEFVHGRPLDAWARGRGWREVVEAVRGAGRGLAAAHAAGIVHRDVKPRNILVGEDGRARVADFGVAHAAEAPGEASVAGATTASGFAGTPAYMAPEQLRGAQLGARCDQFSLCAALYEALHGRRPFQGDSVSELLAAVEKGPPTGPPGDAPEWLRRVIARGLAASPADRFGSTEELVAALGGPRPSLVRRAAPMALLLGLAAVVYAVQRSDAPAEKALPPCDARAATAFGDTWSPARREALIAAFVGTGAPDARAQADATVATIDRLAADWRRQYDASCRAVEVDHTWPAELGGLAGTCLRDRKRELGAMVDGLTRADAAVVSRAHGAVATLLPMTACGDADYLRGRVQPRRDPAEGAEIDEAMRGLSDANTAASLGRSEEAARLAAQLAPSVERLGDPTLAVIFLRVEARLAQDRGDYPAAIDRLKKAYVLARRHRDIEDAAAAAAELVYLLGYQQSQFDAAEDWASLALVEVESLPNSPAAFGVHQFIGVLAERRGQGERAIEHHRRAVDIAARIAGKDHFHYARAVEALGGALDVAGRSDEAAAVLREAMPGIEAAYGAGSPKYAETVNYYAVVLSNSGQHDAARREAARSLELALAAGISGAELATVYMNHGAVLIQAGDLAGIESHAKARELYLAAGATDRAAQTQLNMGQARGRLALERADRKIEAQAIADLTEAARVLEKEWGSDHPDTALAWESLAEIHAERGRCAAALPLARRAMSVYEKEAPDHPYVAGPLMSIGRCHFAAARWPDARAAFERALKLRQESGGDAIQAAIAQGWLGSTLVRSGEKENGQELLRSAHQTLTAAGPSWKTAAARVEGDLKGE